MHLYRGTTNASTNKDIFLTDPVWGADGRVYAHDSGQLYAWNATDGSLAWAMPNPRPNSYTRYNYDGNPVHVTCASPTCTCNITNMYT